MFRLLVPPTCKFTAPAARNCCLIAMQKTVVVDAKLSKSALLLHLAQPGIVATLAMIVCIAVGLVGLFAGAVCDAVDAVNTAVSTSCEPCTAAAVTICLRIYPTLPPGSQS